MRPSSRGRHAALIPLVLSLVTGCKNPPSAPASPQHASDAALGEAAEAQTSGAQMPFANLKLFFEFNSTDNDLGVQLNLDGKDWRRVTAFDPDDRQILQIMAHEQLRELGLTELFFESAEPSPGEVLALFPAGSYRFVGVTVDEEGLVGTATLSHDLPPAPVFSPSNGELVDRNTLVIEWRPIPGIASFQLIVVNENSGRTMTVDLKPSVTRFPVPPAFLDPSTGYKAEVLAIATNGNKTITEGTFVTTP